MESACSISTDISTGTPKGLEIVKSAVVTSFFLVWKFRLVIPNYLSRNPVFSENFPFGKTNEISLSIYIATEISGFFE